jgi:dinuclear metal center YbgI/SA1388 family protein
VTVSVVPIPLPEITGYLDTLLRVAEIPDSANALNGLQVECRRPIGRIVAAVDASQATIEGLGDPQPDRPWSDLLLVHHGLFWDGNRPLTGRRYQRVHGLFLRDAALYSAHVPLDVHPEVGNNAVLARDVGVTDLQPFGRYQGIHLGVSGSLSITRDALVRVLESHLHTRVHVIPGGPTELNRVAVVTGAAAGYVDEARTGGCDTLITGEGMHHTHFDAMEAGVNVLFAGHYATEQVGVKALAEQMSKHLGIPWTFHDHPTGL